MYVLFVVGKIRDCGGVVPLSLRVSSKRVVEKGQQEIGYIA